MARFFTRSSTQIGQADSIASISLPLTIAAWVNPVSVAHQYQFLVQLYDTVAGWYSAIILGTNTAEAAVWDLNRFAEAVTTSTVSTNTWHHVCGTFVSNVSRTVYLNGGNSVENTQVVENTGCTRVYTSADGGVAHWVDGALAEIGIWNVALSAQEIATLASGISPMAVRPQSLKAYWPFFGRQSTEESWFGGAYPMSFTAGTTVSPHPRTTYLSGRMLRSTDTGAEVDIGQWLLPSQDISSGTWFPSAGSPAELWEMLDGSDSPDMDYCYTLESGTMEVKFASGNIPTTEGGTLRYRLTGFNGATDAIVRLKQGNTVLAEWTHTNVPSADTAYSQTLTMSPSISITDASDLRLSVEAV